MSFKVIVISMLCFIITKPIQKQPHLKNQWEHRVLLVISNNRHHADVKRQLKVLQSDLIGLKERKLLLYQVYPECIVKGFNDALVELPNKDWYQIYATKKPLEVLLFGLDGEKKLHSNTLVSLNKLFERIDAMPMRKSKVNQND